MSDLQNMPADQTYNGWTNYATWGVALVLDNDQGTYEQVRDQAAYIVKAADQHENVIRHQIWSPEEAALYELTDWLKDYTEACCGLDGGEDSGVPEPSLMARQLLGAALDLVDFGEIARNVLSES